ncbi:hypothetical protein P1X14_12275 [Sphingomonas sp. AOB5]|uniref:hypothetical protein n=1 Tax=Sphingomonas sp. AOB5 TaxID=3034017 RepID=UPI0023F721DB|nr:hypothetical protein [Sphingomonas sp. AOB5]MDF7776026.1 hypothetical protein [Sphingomonas sp. AOB5]
MHLLFALAILPGGFALSPLPAAAQVAVPAPARSSVAVSAPHIASIEGLRLRIINESGSLPAEARYGGATIALPEMRGERATPVELRMRDSDRTVRFTGGNALSFAPSDFRNGVACVRIPHGGAAMKVPCR